MKLSDVKRHMRVYYRRSNGDTVPAQVRRVGLAKVQIYGNFVEGNRTVWVAAKNLEAQKAEAAE